jgi:NAD(P)-dependent dehydrogenase (short-subunit alcohol dehydrogenase family)
MDLSRFSLEGKTALVTGAGRGIGRTLALGLAGAGARLIVTDIDAASAAGVAREIRATGAAAVDGLLDVAQPGAVEAALAALERAAGGVDVHVNNAGVRDAHSDAYATTVIVRGPFLLSQAVGRGMASRGGGSIVNVASQLGLVGMAGRPAYTASKAALVNLTRTLALEWAPHRIRVNAVAPGPIKTPFTERLWSDPATTARYNDATPLGAWADPDELVGAVVYLASPASRWVTGSVLVADGGYTAR